MSLGDRAVDTGLIVGSIAGERGKRTGKLIEQGLDLRAVIDVTGRQL